MTGGNHVGATLTADGSGITDADGIPSGGIKYHWEVSTDNGSNWTNISGTAGTAATSNTTYTVQASDVSNKTTKIRSVAEFTDNLGAAEIVNGTASAVLAKPILYLQKIGSSSTSKIEIGIFLDDELLTTAAHKKLKTWEVEITPDATWATNFDVITNGFKDAAADKHDSYFMNGDGTFTSNDRLLDTTSFGGTSKDLFSTGGYTPKVSTLDGSSGKAAINPQGTGSVVNLGDTDEWSTTALAANDLKLASLYLNPKDANVGNTVKWNVTANTHYDFWNGSTGVPIDSSLSYLSDPYVFEFVL